MPRSSLRKRKAPISYAEAASEDDDEKSSEGEDSGSGPSKAPSTSLKRRKATSYAHLPRPHPQSQSKLLESLPAEVLDRIFGDPTLNERDHLALSCSCTAIRLGYSESIWTPMAEGHTPFSHNVFTYRLLHDPCNLSSSYTILSERGPAPPVARIWTNALARAADKSVLPGVDFGAPCYKKNHVRCVCMRFMGPSHAKVISNVNTHKTAWGHIFYHYQTLSELVHHYDFTSVERSNPKGIRTDMYLLAVVDAAILEKAGGPWRALRIRKMDQGKPRRGPPKDRDW